MSERTNAVGRLQRISSELREFHRNLEESAIEESVLRLCQATVTQVRDTLSTVFEVLQKSAEPTKKEAAIALLAEERMHRACDLNARIATAIEAGEIRTDQEGLSVYVRILNQTVERIDRVLASLKLDMQTKLEFQETVLTVLLVEDLHTLRKMVREYLESLGMEVLEASDGEEAVRAARSHVGRIDVLLTDVEMPGLSGFQAARQIASLRPGIRIVLMSAGVSKREWNEDKEKLVGTHFVEKPFRLNELKELLASIFLEEHETSTGR